jgi:hypothetical protein
MRVRIQKTFMAVERIVGAGNLVAPRLITSDPMRYGGEDALAVRWARAVVRHSAPRDAASGPPYNAGDGIGAKKCP